MRLLDVNSEVPAQERRVWPRFAYRPRHAVLLLPDGAEDQPVLIWPRNLSAGGASVLVRRALHAGRDCRLVLPDLAGRWVRIGSAVVGSRLLTADTALVSVRFGERIELESFIDPRAQT